MPQCRVMVISNTQAPAHFYLYLNGEGSWVVAPSLSTLPGREILSQDSKVGMVYVGCVMVLRGCPYITSAAITRQGQLECLRTLT